MKKILSALLLSTLLLAACGDDSTESTNTSDAVKETEDVKEDAPKEDVYFKDNEAKLVDLQINITETKVIPVGEEGNEYGEKPVLAIWYDTTNITGKEIDPTTAWVAVFEAVQDNNPNAINELEVGASPDLAFLDSQLETIKEGGTVSNAVAYELDDLETPVTLIASQGFEGKELGRQEIPVK